MPITVMLIEDTALHRKLFTAWLQTGGYQVQIVADARLAYVTALDTKPAVIIVDIRMPYIDGRDVIRNIRANPALATIPIIALTVLTGREDQETCYAAGADMVIAKNVRMTDFLKMVDQVAGENAL